MPLYLVKFLCTFFFPTLLYASSPYASWAHSHMTWLVAGSSQTEMRTMLNGYSSRNITVGALNIDSGWSTGFNNFVVNKTQFPDFQAWLDELHGRSLRVLLWMTSMIDQDSSNFADALSKGYFVRDSNGNQFTNLSWWHGIGGLLDYSQPEARQWWEQSMLSEVLGTKGIDGWKCDGTDPYIIELIEPRGLNGPLTFAQYSDYYYGHTLNFTRSINPEALIWSRPVDSFPLFLNISAYLNYSPKYVMFSGWVGDNNADFGGLRDAAINILESAWQNYTNFGSDTGGYRGAGPEHIRTPEVFLRWAQFNAFLPLFENGGNDDHTPWSFDTPGSTVITDLYRRLVNAHYALSPYLLSTGTTAFARGISALTPTSAPPIDFPFILQPDLVSDWSLALGPYIFVSPIVYENVTEIYVTLPNSVASAALANRFGYPAPSANGWIDFWTNTSYLDGQVVLYNAPFKNVPGDAMIHPVFIKAGALLSLHISTPLPFIPAGKSQWSSALTLFIAFLDINKSSSSTIHDFPSNGIVDEIQVNVSRYIKNTIRFQWNTTYHRPLIFFLRLNKDEQGIINIKEAVWSSSTTNSKVLKRNDTHLKPTLTHPSTHSALSWDQTTRDGGRYPLQGNVSTKLYQEFETDLSSSWSFVDTDIALFLGSEQVKEKGFVDLLTE
jgi:hypothetical protein